MAKIPHVRPGQVITAALYNQIAERLERFASLRSGSPYVRLWDGPYGKSIALALPQQTWARLSGSSSPYSFVEVRDGPGGTWVDMPNGDSGSANVYEANNKAGLDGKVVMLRWTAAADWRFQWVGYQTDCAPDATHVCPCGFTKPTTASFGDDAGTHTLTWTEGLGYAASVDIGGLDLWSAACVHIGTGTQTISYVLQCIPASSVWRLTLTIGIRACSGVLRYSDTLINQIIAEIPFDPVDDMLVFTLPTSYPDPPGAFGSLPVPGGGGTITVIF